MSLDEWNTPSLKMTFKTNNNNNDNNNNNNNDNINKNNNTAILIIIDVRYRDLNGFPVVNWY